MLTVNFTQNYLLHTVHTLFMYSILLKTYTL